MTALPYVLLGVIAVVFPLYEWTRHRLVVELRKAISFRDDQLVIAQSEADDWRRLARSEGVERVRVYFVLAENSKKAWVDFSGHESADASLATERKIRAENKDHCRTVVGHVEVSAKLKPAAVPA